ncbi:beta-eliminating lyase-related protein [Roseovarius salis]|uniref:threonine aldolase family protein n=1 Tax=Roseovarius salis TaxID=3376063 RepID=UPI0037C5E6C5
MHFASDNCGPAHPEILEALAKANEGHSPSYGADAHMDAVRDRVRTIFEAPDASVHLVATGTAANALALSTMADPWQTVFCTPFAHIHTDECNAPEFYTGGAKLTLVGDGDKMSPEDLRAAVSGWTKDDVHVPQRGPVALTQATEMGRVYTPPELSALTAVAREHGLASYMDGARFANALEALGCSPAEMTWKSGLDAVSVGGTKNGCLGVEAVIFFEPGHAWQFELRRKRGAHLFSKHRYLSAQMLAYLDDDLWRRSARAANRRAARLADGLRGVPGAELAAEPEANMIFVRLPRTTHQRLKAAGAIYGLYEGPLDAGAPDEPLLARLVCDWSVSDAEIDRFVEIAMG